MPDEANEQTAEPTETTPPAKGDSTEEKRFSQADVDRVVRERLARAERRADPKPKAPDAPQATEDRLSLKQMNDQMLAMKMERDFDRLALREKLSEDAAEKLMPAYKAARASAGEGWDGAAWLRDIRTALGGTTASPTAPRPAASGNPVSDAGSPAASSASIDDGTPLVHMKPEDRAHFIKTKGLNAYATRLRAELKGTRVLMKAP